MRDHKLGRFQNSSGNTQWLSIGSKTASFSWKQILLASRICLFLKKSVIGSWDRLTHWKCIPDNSVFRGQGAGGRGFCFQTNQRIYLLVPLTPCWQPVSLATSACCVAPGASRCGLSCPQELIVQAPGPELWSLIVSACFLRLMSCFRRGWGPHQDGY